MVLPTYEKQFEHFEDLRERSTLCAKHVFFSFNFTIIINNTRVGGRSTWHFSTADYEFRHPGAGFVGKLLRAKHDSTMKISFVVRCARGQPADQAIFTPNIWFHQNNYYQYSFLLIVEYYYINATVCSFDNTRAS